MESGRFLEMHPVGERRRGGWLTAFLLFCMCTSALGVLLLLIPAGREELWRSCAELGGAAALGIDLLYGVFALAAWHWKRCGAYAIVAAQIASLIVRELNGTPTALSLIVGVVWLVVTIVLFRRVWDLME